MLWFISSLPNYEAEEIELVFKCVSMYVDKCNQASNISPRANLSDKHLREGCFPFEQQKQMLFLVILNTMLRNRFYCLPDGK